MAHGRIGASLAVFVSATTLAATPAPRRASDVVDRNELSRALSARRGTSDLAGFTVVDRDRVTVVQVPPGFVYDRWLPSGTLNAAARADAATSFFEGHADAYDFLVTVTDFDVSLGDSVAGLYWSVRSSEQGTGQDPIDLGPWFGSDARLQGVIDLGRLALTELAPGSEAETWALTVLMHELGHRHLVYAAVSGSDVIGREDSHWSALFSNGGSFLYGADWVETQPGTWVSMGSMKRYSKLDLYLMGLVGSSEVEPLRLLEHPTADPDDLPAEAGVVLSGVTGSREVRVEDVIAENGARVPDVNAAQKDFRSALLFLTERDPGSIPAADLATLRGFGERASQQFFFETGGRGTVDVGLAEPPGPTSTTFDVPAALAWLRSRQRPDGSFADGTYTVVRDTAEAVAALRLDPAGATALQGAETYLRGEEPASTDALARLVLALGPTTPADRVSELSSRQDAGGGFGTSTLYLPDALDTALARRALRGYAEPPGQKDLAWITAEAGLDGGFAAVRGGPSRVGPTAAVTLLLARALAEGPDPALAAVRDRAVAFLLSAQNTDGGFGDSPSSLHGTALALEALGAVDGVSADVISDGEQYLATRQDPSGSLGGSVYATSLAIRLLRAALLPDLVVDALHPETQAFAGQRVEILVAVRNRRPGTAAPSKLRLWDGDPASGVLVGTVDVPGLAAGQTTLVRMPWDVPAGGAGFHTVHAMADADATVMELLEDNNVHAARFEVLPGDADLRVESFTALPSQVEPGRPIDLTLQLRSTGSRTLPAVLVRLTMGTTVLREETVAFPGPGTRTVVLSVPAPTGTPSVAFAAVIDPENVIPESNEANNVASATVTITENPLPNARVTSTDIALSPTPGVRGDVVSALVTVHNTGSQPIGAMKVELHVTDVLLNWRIADSVEGVAVPAGGTTDVSLEFVAPPGDRVTVAAVLDPDAAVVESDETDNRASLIHPLTSRPDLAVSAADVALDPAYPRSGDVVRVGVTVRNLSGVTSDPATVRLLLGEDEATAVPVGSDVALPPLPAGGSTTTPFLWSTSGLRGLQVLHARVTSTPPDVDPGNDHATVRTGVQDGDFFVFTPYFSPNGDGVLDEAVVAYRVEEALAARITVRPMDGDGTVAVLPDRRQGGSGLTTWDGKDLRGAVVRDGRYRIVFEAIDGETATELAVLACEVDTNARNLYDLAANGRTLENEALTCRMARLGYPAYGPDDALYVPGEHLGVRGLFRLEGGATEALHDVGTSADALAVDLSADGSHAALLVQSSAGASELWLLDLRQRPAGAVLVTADANSRGRVVFSHDSRRFAFSAGTALQVARTDAPSAAVTVGQGREWTGVAFGEDDRHVYFGAGALMKADVETGVAVEALAAPPGADASWGQPQEIEGGALVLAEMTCRDGCRETGRYVLHRPGAGTTSDVELPLHGTLEPLQIHGSPRGPGLVLQPLWGGPERAVYRRRESWLPGRGQIVWSPRATRVLVADGLEGCSSAGGFTFVESRSLDNGAARLAYAMTGGGHVVELRATAADLNLARVTLEYRAASNPSIRGSIVPSLDRPAIAEVIASWIPPADDLYEVRLTVEDKAGNTSGATANVRYERPFAVKGLSFAPRYISPLHVDGRNDDFRIAFDVVDNVPIRFEIVDGAGTAVRTFLHASGPATGQMFLWDGRDEQGSPVPDGPYRLRVTTDPQGTPTTVVLPESPEDAFVVDNTPPTGTAVLGPPYVVERYDAITRRYASRLYAVLTLDVQEENPVTGLTGSHEIVAQGGIPDVDATVEDLAGNRADLTATPIGRVLVATGYDIDRIGLPALQLSAYKLGGRVVAGYESYGPFLQSSSSGTAMWVVQLGWTWPGVPVDVVVEGRRPSEPDYRPMSHVARGALFGITEPEIATSPYLVRFRAKDPAGATYVTSEVRLHGVKGGAGCEIAPPAHEPSTTCPGDPPSYDVLLNLACDAADVRWHADELATGQSFALGTQPQAGPQHAPFRWLTAGFPEGKYHVWTDHLGPEDGAPAYVDRTPPAYAFTMPREGSTICADWIGVTLDPVLRGVDIVLLEWGRGSNPGSYEEVICRDGDCKEPPATTVLWNPVGLPAGIYSLRATYVDRPNTGGPYFCRQSVVSFHLDASVEVTPPQAVPPLFSPNGDGLLDETLVRYALSEPIVATTRIRSAATVVRTLEAGAAHDPALQSTVTLPWDGRDDAGQPLPSGTYEIELLASDACGNDLTQTETLDLDVTPPDAILDPPAGMTQPVYRVRGTANDAHFQGYQLLLGQGQAPATFVPVVDGTSAVFQGTLGDIDTAGLTGDYVVRLHVRDAVGLRSTVDQPVSFGAGGLIRELRADPDPFSPNGDGALDVTAVRYGVNQTARLDLHVVDRGGSNVLATIFTDVVTSEGSTTRSWDGAGLPDGDYDLLLHATEEPPVAPVEEDEVRAPVSIDRAAPEVSIAAPVEGASTRASVEVTGTARDPHFDRFVLSHRAPGQALFTVVASGLQGFENQPIASLQGLAEGRHELLLSADDRAGNRAEATVSFDVDTTAPAVSIGAPAAGTFVSPLLVAAVPVTGDVQDAHLASFTLVVRAPSGSETTLTAGNASGTVGASWVTTGLTDGTYTLVLAATDRAGNTASVDRVVEIDGTIPAVDVTAPASGQMLGGSTEVRGTAADAHLALYTVAYTRAPATPESLYIPIGTGSASVWAGLLASWVALPPDGSYVLRLLATDRAGNTASVARPVGIDTVPPGAPHLSGTASGTRYQLVWTGPADGDVTGFEIFREGRLLNGSLVTVPSYTDVVDPPVPTRYQVRAVDHAGSRGPLSNEVVLDGRAPEARIDAPVHGATVSGDVRITGRAWADVGFAEYEVRVGQGGSFQQLQRSSLPVAGGLLCVWPTFGVSGTWDIELEVRSASGLSSTDRVTVTVDNDPEEAPVLSATASGSDVTLTISTDPQTETVAFQIFRDGRLITRSGIARTGTDTVYVDAAVPDGTWVYQALGLDAAGNQSPFSNEVTVTLDARRPVIAVVRPSEGARFLASPLVTAESPDEDVTEVRLSYSADGAGFTVFATDVTAPFEALWNVTGLPYGGYYLRAEGCDLGGCGTPHTISVWILPAAMTLSGRSDADTAQLSWSALAHPLLTGYEVVCTGVPPVAVPGTQLSAAIGGLAEGTVTCEVRAMNGPDVLDRSNSLDLPIWSPWLNEDVRLVTPAATIALDGAPGPGGPFDVALLASVDNVTFSEVATLTGQQGRFRFAAAPLVTGPNFLRVRAEDAAGNASKPSATVLVIHEPLPAPPTSLAAVVTGDRVDLTFTPSVTAGQRGTFLYRDAALLNERPNALLSCAAAPGLTDGDLVTTAWTSPADESAIELAVQGGPVYGLAARVSLTTSGFARLETDGPLGFPVVLAHLYESGMVAFQAAFPVTTLRLVGTQGLGVAEVELVREDPIAGGTAFDEPVPEGTHVYVGKAMAAWGSLSPPSAGATVAVGPAEPVLSPALSLPASFEHPQDVASTPVRIAGLCEPNALVALMQDGEPSGTATARAASSAPVALAGRARSGAAALTSDGAKVLYVDELVNQVLVLDLATAATTQLAPGMGGTGEPVAALRRAVAAVVGVTASQADVYVVDLVTGMRRRITNDPAYETSLGINAAAERVAFVAEGTARVVETATGAVLRSDIAAEEVRLSPDGSHLAVRTSTTLLLAEATGSAPAVVVTAGLARDGDFDFSPDGASVVHVSDSGAGVRLHRTSVFTAQTVEIGVPFQGALHRPRFGSSGRWLLLADELPSETMLLTVDLEAAGRPVVAAREPVLSGARPGAAFLGKDARVYYVAERTLFSVEPAGRFEVTTHLDPGPNVFTATARRQVTGDPTSAASAVAIVSRTGLDAPNLLLETLASAPPVPVQGDLARVTAVVRNDGSRPAGPFLVDFRLRVGATGPATSIGQEPVPGLAPGATAVTFVDLDTTGLAGRHEVTAVADAAAAVAERSETDNARTEVLLVAAMDGVNVATTVTPAAGRPGDPLALRIDLLNAGIERDLELLLELEDAAGMRVATILGRAFPAFAYGRAERLETVYALPAIVPGSYRVATSVTSAGTVVASDDDAVTVLPAGTLTASLAASKLLYQPGETVRLDAGVASSAEAAQTETGLLARLLVVDDGTNALRFEDVRALPALPPGGRIDYAVFPDLATAPAGSYTATLSVLEGTELRTSDTASFGIAGSIDLDGDLTVSFVPGNVLLGYEVTNGTGTDITGATMRVLLFDPRSGSILLNLSETRTLPTGTPVTGSFTVDRAALPSGFIRAVLQAEGVSEGTAFLQELDREQFALMDGEPPTVTPISPTSGSVKPAALVIRASATDSGSGVAAVEARLDSRAQPLALFQVAGNEWAVPATLDPSEEGDRLLVLTATDAAGNASLPVTVPFVADLSPPVIQITGVTDGGSYAEDLHIVVSVTDAHPGLTLLTLDGVARVSPIDIAADGSYTLRVSTTDRAGNAAAAVVRFRRDTADPVASITAPAEGATVIESADVIGTAMDANLDGWTLSFHPAGNPQASTIVASGTTPVWAGLLGVFDPSPLPDGAYVLRLEVTDLEGRRASDEVSVNVVHGTLEITKSIPFDGRVLLWAGCATGQACAPPPPAFLIRTIEEAGLPYEVAYDAAQFLAKLRSGRFNVHVLYRPPAPNVAVYTELREAVFRGEGLVVVKEHPDAMPNLETALGVEFRGQLQRGADISVELLASPIGDPSILQAPGDAIVVDLDGATRAATFRASGDPAATTYGFGFGRSVLFAFDVEAAASPELRAVLRRALSWVTPSTASPLVPGGVVPVEIAVENRGTTAATYRVVETVPPELTVIAVYDGPTSTSPPTWEGSIAPGETVTLGYLVRLPATTGAWELRSDLYVQNGAQFVLHRSALLTVSVGDGRPELYGDLLSELASLQLAYPGEANRIQKVRTEVQRAKARTGPTDPEIEAAISDLAKASDELPKVVAPTETARVLLSTVLRYEEIRWATN